ncbi:hypothetical protein A1O3_04919 [Capronia epimyces CBS 606.96]|uniref:Transcription factor domain-containing protein n=1 Tax=Capronia epimyces CBS 606.96 TaxID=1182542 RepID=W9XUK7_9EURO|nr:uncharacterized protein A1O3_04919 [Capronia epimyces CBS 606.96]EXJ84252.1 hypothetical protein A1O3_04919 [Capronia epimyces CBS 606.96]
MNEARISTLNQLSFNLSEIDKLSSTKKVELIIVVIMFGLSSSWCDLDDLGLAHYNAAATLLRDLDGKELQLPLQNYQYFEECLTYWWMMLSFACDPSREVIHDPPRLTGMRTTTGCRFPHPLTGISSEVQYLLGKVGYLVFSQRRRVLDRPLTTTDELLQSLSNIEKARGLESQLQTLDFPRSDSIADPKDPSTPVTDLVNIANAYRVCGLLLLYHAFPDLLRSKLTSETLGLPSDSCYPDWESRRQFLGSLSLHALRILGGNNELSGTRTIEAILLVIISGELGWVTPTVTTHQGQSVPVELEDEPRKSFSPEPDQGDGDDALSSGPMLEARNAVLARFERVKSILPFKTINRMKTLVLKTCELMDQGKDVFWVDVLLDSKWQFLMI